MQGGKFGENGKILVGRTFVYAMSTWHAQKKMPHFVNLSNYAYFDRI